MDNPVTCHLRQMLPKSIYNTRLGICLYLLLKSTLLAGEEILNLVEYFYLHFNGLVSLVWNTNRFLTLVMAISITGVVPAAIASVGVVRGRRKFMQQNGNDFSDFRQRSS